MFDRHDYKFGDYIKFQENVQSKRRHLTQERDNRCDYIAALKETFPDAKKALCVGSRHPSEVEDMEAGAYEVDFRVYNGDYLGTRESAYIYEFTIP